RSERAALGRETCVHLDARRGPARAMGAGRIAAIASSGQRCGSPVFVGDRGASVRRLLVSSWPARTGRKDTEPMTRLASALAAFALLVVAGCATPLMLSSTPKSPST